MPQKQEHVQTQGAGMSLCCRSACLQVAKGLAVPGQLLALVVHYAHVQKHVRPPLLQLQLHQALAIQAGKAGLQTGVRKVCVVVWWWWRHKPGEMPRKGDAWQLQARQWVWVRRAIPSRRQKRHSP